MQWTVFGIILILMKVLTIKQTNENNRLIIQSIRLQIIKQNEYLHRGRLKTLSDPSDLQIFRSKRKRKSPPIGNKQIIWNSPQSLQSLSFPLKPSKWKSQQKEELKRIRSGMLVNRNVNDEISYSQNKAEKEKGPAVLIRYLTGDIKQKNESEKLINKAVMQKQKIGFNQLKVVRKQRPSLEKELTIEPLKITVDLPRIKKEEILSFFSKKRIKKAPFHILERSLILDKKPSNILNPKLKPIQLSPWATKGQLHTREGFLS